MRTVGAGATCEPAQGGVLTLAQVARCLGVSHRALYRLRESGEFPKPADMGYSRVLLWHARDIFDWRRVHRGALPS